jgi:hypothetical protein
VRRTPASLLALTLLATGAPAAFLAGPAVAADPSSTGLFSAPFEEAGERCTTAPDGEQTCKPAAGSIGVLPNGKLVYWDALDSIQEAQYNGVLEFGHQARNDMARVLDLRGAKPVFSKSDPNTSVDPAGNDGKELLPGPLHNNDEKRNDGDLFCSDQVFLADGRILDVGGTAYYQEPGVPGQPTYGVVELEGLKNSRIYDGASNTWKASGQMTYGRWYPSVVTLPDSKVMAFSGVTKLLKPVYADRPADSGRNVTQSEVYDPKTGTWTVDGGSKSLPLYPRLHLLPNGNVYYDAAGQTFNPAGQAYDEALWNMAASYDPKTKTWKDLGLPEFGNGLKGFRGSAFSQMLPLKPNAQGVYDTVDVLSAGGVYGVSPGTYVGTDTSTLNTIKVGADGKEAFSSRTTGKLNNPRWYSTGVSLPTGEVIAFSGADRDEVVAPGFGKPVTTPEMYDPKTGTWTELASQGKGRTYHNTATLLTDGRVLVGGHAPIITGYGKSTDALEKGLGFSNPNRDPSFEIFSPPNLFYGARPVITDVRPSLQRGRTLEIATPDAAGISSVSVVRNTAMTHLVDSDQRTVVLPVVKRSGGSVTVAVTDNAAVLPDGPYNLFVNKKYAKGETPSVGRQVFVGDVPAGLADDLSRNHAAATDQEMAARDQAQAAKKNESKGKKKGQADGKGGNGAAPVAAAAGAPAVRPVTSLPVDADLRSRSSSWSSPLPVAALALSSLVAGVLVLRRRRARA